jgi:hypothetical protein
VKWSPPGSSASDTIAANERQPAFNFGVDQS